MCLVAAATNRTGNASKTIWSVDLLHCMADKYTTRPKKRIGNEKMHFGRMVCYFIWPLVINIFHVTVGLVFIHFLVFQMHLIDSQFKIQVWNNEQDFRFALVLISRNHCVCVTIDVLKSVWCCFFFKVNAGHCINEIKNFDHEQHFLPDVFFPPTETSQTSNNLLSPAIRSA